MSTTFSVAETDRLIDRMFRPSFEPMPTIPSPGAVVATKEEEPVDMVRLRDMVDDDATAMRELVTLYRTEADELMGNLRNAVKTRSAIQVEWAAHKLGGSSATCGMSGVVAPLRELERTVKAEVWPLNELLLLEASRQMERIRLYLSDHVLAA